MLNASNSTVILQLSRFISTAKMCSLTNILLVTICLSFVNANDGLKSEVPNLLELAKQLNLTEFVKGLEETGISHVINHEGRNC